MRQVWRGLSAYPKGLAWLRSHPRYLLVLSLPTFIALVTLVSASGWLLQNQNQMLSYFHVSEPVVWYLWLPYVVGYYLFSLILLAISFLVAVICINILSAPIYDYVSAAVERDLTGGVVEISLVASLLLVFEEAKRAAFILAVTFALLFIPFVNFLSLPITAFLIGWDYYDYALARRGWSFGKRLQFVLADFGSVMGMGLWLMIPFIQLLLAPAAIVGATILSVERLQAKGLLRETG